jgi:hypothetical protein
MLFQQRVARLFRARRTSLLPSPPLPREGGATVLAGERCALPLIE